LRKSWGRRRTRLDDDLRSGREGEGQHVAFERKPVPRIKHSERSATQPNFLLEEKPELFPEPVLTFAPEEEELEPVMNFQIW
jgi:hypothetical protein